MRGLIEKDLRLLLQRKQTAVMFVALAAFMGISSSPVMMVSYLTLITSALTVGTISYDEFDNGYPFLMTLPFERKTYAAEKYVFCGLGALCSWAIGVVGMCVLRAVRGETEGLLETIGVSTVFIPLSMVFCALLIPLQIKYGSEKSRLVLYIILGLIAGLIALFGVMGTEKTGELAVGVMETVGSVSPLVIVLAAWVLCGILCFVSYLWCRRIVENKEF